MSDIRYINVVFSSTPYKIGSIIRTLTRNYYNHVSIGLENSDVFYSFARRYSEIPLFGGFVEESHSRFFYNGKPTYVKICSVPVDEKTYAEIENDINNMLQKSGDYLYNSLSAASFLIHKRVLIHNSFTCVEFAVAMLGKYKVIDGLEPFDFCTVKALEDKLSGYETYRGRLNVPENYAEDPFFEKKSVKDKVVLSAVISGKLLARLIKERKLKKTF